MIIFWITGVVFVGTQVALAWAPGSSPTRPGRVAVYFHGSQRLELIWTILPAIALVFITVYQFGTWANVKFKSAKPNGSRAAGRGRRAVSSSGSSVTPGPDGKIPDTPTTSTRINDLHFVKDQMTLIQLRSKDVLHSFFLPQLRIKQDAVPGMTIPVWFDADQAGHYELACAELCGWGHYKMRGNVTVHETQAEFDDWLKGAAAREQGRDQVAPAAGPRGEMSPTMSHEPAPAMPPRPRRDPPARTPRPNPLPGTRATSSRPTTR